MKIIHVVYSLIPLQFRGGISKIVHELSEAQAKLGHDVTVLTTLYNGKEKVFLNGKLDKNKYCYNVIYFNATLMSGVYSSIPMKRYLEQNAKNIDVIHSHNTFHPLNLQVKVIGKKHKINTFFHTHGSLDEKVLSTGRLKKYKKRLYIKLIERNILNNAKAVFANTKHEKQQLIKVGIEERKIKILPNGINYGSTNLNSANRTILSNIPKDKFLISFIGRIHPKKGIHVLIEAFYELKKKTEDIALLIGGDVNQYPIYYEELKELVIKYNLKNHVHWLGFINESTKYEILKITNLFSHVSKSEGMAMSILEAMSYGVPTIVGRGCYMDVAVQKGAIIESEFNAQMIAKNMLKIFQSSKLQKELSKNSSFYIEEYHNWTDIAKRTIEIYQT